MADILTHPGGPSSRSPTSAMAVVRSGHASAQPCATRTHRPACCCSPRRRTSRGPGVRRTSRSPSSACLLLLLTSTVSRGRRQPRHGRSATCWRRSPVCSTRSGGCSFWAPVVWAATLLVASLVRRRRASPATSLASGVLAGAIAVARRRSSRPTARGTSSRCSPTPTAHRRTRRARSRSAAAMISTASPHVSRPFRHLGRWLIGGQLLASLLLGSATLTGASPPSPSGCSPPRSSTSSSGSPGGRPTTSRIRLALRRARRRRRRPGAGVDARARAWSSSPAHDAQGPLAVKVYGRDAWDAQLLANVWRLAWYRGAAAHGPPEPARAGRARGLRHAARRAGRRARARTSSPPAAPGAATPSSSSARTARRCDATDAPTSATDRASPALWDDLDRLHDAGIVHRRLDLDRVVAAARRLRRVRRPVVGVGRRAARRRPAATRPRRSALVDGAGRRGARRRRRQRGARRRRPAAPSCRTCRKRRWRRRSATRCDDADVELDDVRNRLRALLGAEEQPLIKLRRVTWGSVLNLALLAIAAYTLIAVFGDVDLGDVRRRAARRPAGGGSRSPSCSPSCPGSRRRSARWARSSAAAARAADRACSSPSATSTWRSPARRRGWPSTCGSSSASASRRRRRCPPA